MKLHTVVITLMVTILGVSCSPKSENTQSKKEGFTKPIEKNYEEIKWDVLLSEEELAFYINEMELYRADPNYTGATPPPTLPNKKVDRKTVKIPGFPVAVDTVPGEYNKAKTFILVPTAGACIHVPAPPENQTIYVEMDHEVTLDPYTPVYIEGTLYIEEGSNDIAGYFYKIVGDDVYDY